MFSVAVWDKQIHHGRLEKKKSFPRHWTQDDAVRPLRLRRRTNGFLIRGGEALEPTAGLISGAEIPEQRGGDSLFVTFEKVSKNHQQLQTKCI